MASLHYYYSTMNAGKSAALLQANHNYIERKMKTYLLKPSIDTREEAPLIRSRTGLQAECELFDKEDNLFEIVSEYTLLNGNIDVVMIDESQFMTPEQVFQLTDIVDKLGIPVLAYGLRSDFQGNLFPGSAGLFALAERFEEVRTICWCGCRATMVLRLNEDGTIVREGNQVQIGGNSSYVSVCREHFKSGQLG